MSKTIKDTLVCVEEMSEKLEAHLISLDVNNAVILELLKEYTSAVKTWGEEAKRLIKDHG